MIKSNYLIIAVFLIMNSFNIYADELVFYVSSSIPPYFIKETNNGLQHEIMEAALNEVGHSIETIKYVSNKRAEESVLTGVADIALNVPNGHHSLYYADIILHYENMAISLDKNNIVIDKISDLNGKKITGFQNASRLLGDEFLKLTLRNKSYTEVPKQISQVFQLFLGRTDVIVLDRRIFLYYRDVAKNEMDVSDAVAFHRIFPLTPRTAAFSNVKIRNDFNRGLKMIKENGVYDRIMDKYSK